MESTPIGKTIRETFVFDASVTGVTGSGNLYVNGSAGASLTVGALTNQSVVVTVSSSGLTAGDVAQARGTFSVTTASGSTTYAFEGKERLMCLAAANLPAVDSNNRVDVGKIAGTTQTARDLGAGVNVNAVNNDAGAAVGAANFFSGMSGVAGSSDGLLGLGAAFDGNSVIPASLSGAQATYLANLNIGGLVAGQSDIQGITQAQRVRVMPPPQMERPDDSTPVAYRVWIYVYNEQHRAEDLDAVPTVTAENNAGTDRSSNLGTVTKESGTTGIYYVDYTVEQADAVEGIVFKVTATEDGVPTRYAQSSFVVDTTAVDYTAADRARDDALAARATEDRLAKLDVAGTLAHTGNADTFKADVAGLATETNATANKDAVLAAIDDIEGGGGGFTEDDRAALTQLVLDNQSLPELDDVVEGVWTAAQRTTTGGTINNVTNPVSANVINSGSGETPVNHDTGGVDNIRQVRIIDGVSVGVRAHVRAYLTEDFVMLRQKAPIRGEAQTGDDGRWLQDMMLDAGSTYTFVGDRGHCGQSQKEVTVPSA
jgi:hypothetical protein